MLWLLLIVAVAAYDVVVIGGGCVIVAVFTINAAVIVVTDSADFKLAIIASRTAKVIILFLSESADTKQFWISWFLVFLYHPILLAASR